MRIKVVFIDPCIFIVRRFSAIGLGVTYRAPTRIGQFDLLCDFHPDRDGLNVLHAEHNDIYPTSHNNSIFCEPASNRPDLRYDKPALRKRINC
jgi:hypothetical protein